MDGNFEQKRLKHAGSGDQPVPKTGTVFIDPTLVEDMRRRVNDACQQAKRGNKRNESLDDKLDGLPLPNHVYDGCNSRFYAADESNKKAETRVWEDTGLVALTCRHDRIISLVSLKDAGEKQLYPLVAIEQLFKELPSAWVVGILYDIGCQLDRSIKKVGTLFTYWKFLS